MRRVFAISLAILIVMLATRGVMAQDSQQDGNDLLLKILKEKNILTAEQFQDIKGQLAQQRNETEQQLTALDRSLADYLAKTGDTVGGNDTYVQNQGVTFSSGDGMWSIYFGGLFQFGYFYESGDTQDSHGGFEVAENRFHFGGTIFDPNLTFYTQIQTTHIDSDYYYFGGVDQSSSYVYGDFLNILDAYIDYRLTDAIAIKAGMFKVPYGRQALVDKSDLAFGYRSQTSNYFTEWRDTGVMLHSTMPMDENDPNGMTFEWAVGLWNGMGGNTYPPYNDTWLAWGGRAAIYPMGPMDYVEGDWNGSDDPRIGIGASLLFDESHNSGGGDNPKATSWEVDAVLTWMGIYFTGEYHSYKWDNGSTDTTDTGWFVQGGYFLMPGEFEILGRYGIITYDNDDTDSEWALGVAYYFTGSHEWKAIASLGQTSFEPNHGSSQDDWFIDFGVQADW
jgi:hypothetical protein